MRTWMKGLAVAATLPLVASSCGPSRPSENEVRSGLERTAEGSDFKVVGFVRTNGQQLSEQEYKVLFQATYEVIAERGHCRENGGGSPFWDSGRCWNGVIIPKGENVTANGEAVCQKSEKGWLCGFWPGLRLSTM